MSRWSRLIPGIAVAVLLTACGSNGGDTPLSPTLTPRMDGGGGGVIVNGNAAPTDSATSHNSTAAAMAEPDSTGSPGATGGVIVNGN